MSIDRCKCPVCAALPSSPTLIAPPSESVTYTYHGGPGPVATLAASQTIFDLVKADLGERDRIGAAQHGGRPLLANAKKDWLAELYAELLDAAVYIRGLLEQRKAQ